MRIQIKTDKPIKDKDIKALHLINEAMKISTPNMRMANLRFFLEREAREAKP